MSVSSIAFSHTATASSASCCLIFCGTHSFDSGLGMSGVACMISDAYSPAYAMVSMSSPLPMMGPSVPSCSFCLTNMFFQRFCRQVVLIYLLRESKWAILSFSCRNLSF
mmetsp:Transcript_9775/g.18316  ORF Transcript_9775/g.18316 Transcript_9775/m.18316 type:complete len:109 (+) Transcript_9775:598-924(+)